MLCAYPFRKGVLELGCGRCHGCRTNHSRLWVGRMLLESYEHEFSCFVTLTYDKKHLPAGGHLWKKHVQLFLKSLREKISPRLIRFYCVGEYGEKSWRPHYHLVIFGVSPLEGKLIQTTWKYGYTFTGTAEARSMSYVAQYVVKKMTNPKDRRLKGRPPEFSLMSLKPGIGMGAVQRIKKAIACYPSMTATQIMEITQVRAGTSKYPLGRYLRGKLHDAVGVLPEQKRAHIRTTVERIFNDSVSDGAALSEIKRRARVVASHGMGKVKTGGTL